MAAARLSVALKKPRCIKELIMKLCKACKTPEKCKKAGKCLAKGYAEGGALKMVEKDGKKVPFYAADGEGKMMAGGKVKKGYKKGGMARGCGAAVRGTKKAKIR